jgi:hypothetical protein
MGFFKRMKVGWRLFGLRGLFMRVDESEDN